MSSEFNYKEKHVRELMQELTSIQLALKRLVRSNVSYVERKSGLQCLTVKALNLIKKLSFLNNLKRSSKRGSRQNTLQISKRLTKEFKDCCQAIRVSIAKLENQLSGTQQTTEQSPPQIRTDNFQRMKNPTDKLNDITTKLDNTQETEQHVTAPNNVPVPVAIPGLGDFGTVGVILFLVKVLKKIRINV